MNYIIATIKSWNLSYFKKIKKSNKENHWFLISKKENLTFDRVKKINPRYIFFPHWSWIIPEEIWKNYECVVFHMTDLPYGRGGSPLQNLIIRGHKKTKISSLKVGQGMDTGGIYLKRDLSLHGNAEEIYKRAAKIIFFQMIPSIIKNNLFPQKQVGRAIVFRRRNPKQSKILNNMDLKKTYDLIRMLDAEGYPKAFLDTKRLKIEFSKAKIKKNKLLANVEIYEK
ncbi:MAG: methionyl-tRNA formyltransferase [Parcubacteria group bacterium]